MPWYVGIDENGLGPQLGPLIVTAVLARLSDAAEKQLSQDPCAFLHERLADSKKLVDHRHVALGEAWARVLGGDPVANDPASLVESLSLDSLSSLQAPCPQAAKPQCWSTRGERFEADEAKLERAREDLIHLRAQGIDVVWTRSSITCVKRMNEARGAGVGRLDLDLRSMEALIVAARKRAGAEIVARCGKVGGLMRYANKFTLLSDHLLTVIDEQRSDSIYRLAGLGQVHFMRDAEGRDPLVSLSSLVGKWVREVLMGRITRFYRGHDDALPDASGYNDPVTDRFVRGSASLRSGMGIADGCFLRASGSKKPNRVGASTK
jgi:ribonuclease HII